MQVYLVVVATTNTLERPINFLVSAHLRPLGISCRAEFLLHRIVLRRYRQRVGNPPDRNQSNGTNDVIWWPLRDRTDETRGVVAWRLLQYKHALPGWGSCSVRKKEDRLGWL